MYPLIADDPSPAVVPGTVFEAVKAYAAEASTPARSTVVKSRLLCFGRLLMILRFLSSGGVLSERECRWKEASTPAGMKSV